MNRSLRFTAASLLVVLLAGCGGSSAPSASTAPGSTGGTPAATAGGGSQTKAGPAALTSLKLTSLAYSPTSILEEVAIDQGIFKKYGLSVELVGATGGTQGIQTVLAGSAQITDSSPAAALAAMPQGAGLVDFASSSPSGDYQFLSRVAKDKLASARIATSGAGLTADHVAEIIILKAMGVDPAKPVFVPVGGLAARLAAVSQGTVDATVVSSATAAAGYDKTKIQNLGSIEGLKAPFVTDDYLTTAAFYQQNPQTIEAFCKALIEAAAFILNPANKEAVLKVYERKDWANLNPQQAEIALQVEIRQDIKKYPAVDPAAEKAVQDASALIVPAVAKVDLNTFIKTEPMATLQKNGFADQFYRK